MYVLFCNDIRSWSERMIYASRMISAARMIYACGVLWNGYYIILRRRSNISYLREQIYHTRASEYIIKREKQVPVFSGNIPCAQAFHGAGTK